MSSKGKIDNIVDIPKIEDQIKFVLGSLDKVIASLEKVSETSATIRFDGFGKAKGVKDTTQAAEELNKQMAASEPLMKQLNALMKDKSTLEAKLVTLQTEEAKKTVELKMRIQEKNKAVQDDIRLNSSSVGLLERMRIQLEQLKKAYVKATTVEQQNDILKQIQELSPKVLEAEKAMGVFNRQVGNYELAGKSMRTEIRQMTVQLAEMKLQGLENSKAYQDLSEKAGALADAMGDARAEVTKFSSDTKSLDQFISVAEGLAGAYTAVEGASALLGVENEELQQTFVKLQAAMAVLNGLRSLQNVLQKESAAYTLAENIQKKLSVVLTYAQNKAETGGVVTRKLATAAQWALNAAMAANPAGLLLIALAALVGIGYVLFKVFSSNAEIQKAYSIAIENTKKSVESLNRELEKNVRAMEAMGASQQEIIREKIKAAQEEYDQQSRLISMLLADYKNLNKEQKEQLKSLQEAQRDNNDKISQLNDDLFSAGIKQTQQAQKIKLDTMKDGLSKELALMRYNAQEEIKQAGDNTQLVAAIKSKLAKDETDTRKKYAEEYLKSERDVVVRLEESRIGLMKEGFSKELALSKLSAGQKIAELEDQLKYEENLSVEARKRINQTITNLRKEQLVEEEKLIVEWGIKANEKQIELINLRLESAKQGSDDELELKLRTLELQRQNEVANAEQTGMDVAAINAKYDKLKSDEALNFMLGQLNKESRQRLLSVESGLQKELKSLRDQLENKEISIAEFEKQREALENKYNIKRAENQINLAQQELDKIKAAGGDILSAEEKLVQAQMALDEAKTANFIANRTKEKEAQEKLKDKLIELGQEFYSTVVGFQNAQLDSQLVQLDDQAKLDQEAKDKELKRVAGNKAAEDQILARYAAKEKEREAQRKAIELEKAKFAKIASLFQIAINTAVGISKTIAEMGMPAAIPFVAAAGLMGLLQAGLVAAQPLPKYFRGRESGPAEFAWVGEQGVEAIKHQGKVTLTPDKPTITFLPEGAKVIPHHKLDTLRESHAIQSAGKGNYYDFSRLEDGFQELSTAIRNKKEYHLSITEHGLRKFVKSGSSITEYLNRNVRL